MSRYLSKKVSDHGDFSTSFADLIFGLLFFFFLLTIAMVFNKPDVDAFQKKLDELQRKLDKQTEIVAETQKKLAEEQQELERLKKKALEKMKTVKVAPAKVESFAAELNEVKKENEKLQNALAELLRDYDELRKKLQLLEDVDGEDNAKRKKSLAKLKAENRRLEAELEQMREQKEIVQRHSNELQAIINKVKEILKQKGQADILAEVQKMEDDLKESERKDQIGENELFNDYKIWAAYDPTFGSLAAEVWEGETLQQEYPSMEKEELTNIGKELTEWYKQASENYTELEKAEHMPKLFLRVHPNTPYGDVQLLMQTLSKGIPVVIVPWEK